MRDTCREVRERGGSLLCVLPLAVCVLCRATRVSAQHEPALTRDATKSSHSQRTSDRFQTSARPCPSFFLTEIQGQRQRNEGKKAGNGVGRFWREGCGLFSLWCCLPLLMAPFSLWPLPTDSSPAPSSCCAVLELSERSSCVWSRKEAE